MPDPYFFDQLILILALSVNGVDVQNDKRASISNGQPTSLESTSVPIEPVEENTKTKSVLQGKLSNLAIQIGYIGRNFTF